MKIGIMGLGNIAQKAYLPIMGATQSIDWVLHTRDEEKINSLKNQYNFNEAFTDFDAFLNSGIKACFIHTPTHTHYEYIKTMLEHDIHVYVDKPISQNIDETKELIQLAQDKNLILMSGFNRRHAPLTQKLKAIKNKNMIVVRKNRSHAIQDTQFALYDMMIHVVDTALYLLDDEIISMKSKVIESNNTIDRAILNIETETCSLVAYMNMNSGARPETFEVMSSDIHAIVDDLNTYTTVTNQGKIIETFPDWTPTLERRGFQAIITHFIDLVSTNTQHDTTQDLLSHEVIEAMYKSEQL